jgi:hypothetical protein
MITYNSCLQWRGRDNHFPIITVETTSLAAIPGYGVAPVLNKKLKFPY